LRIIAGEKESCLRVFITNLTYAIISLILSNTLLELIIILTFYYKVFWKLRKETLRSRWKVAFSKTSSGSGCKSQINFEDLQDCYF
jgi:hypothetical protein